ncbi:MAG: NADP-dependent isocitrate dehydrogenase, partial [Gemmatimonadota bacterium]|nr:NADP-dependent isocitrate dehydrogenase [Gemmatimonadota bacterium]
MSQSPSIIYTWTDEAPALATHAFLPVIRAFAGATGVPVETRDISLAGRILAVFPDVLGDAQRIPDDLAELGKLVETPEANIIKLPNVSASIPQLKACVAEL